MARYNEILVGRYNRFMQKLFSMKGGAVAPQLASEIAPAFPLFSGAENRYLEGWDRFAFAVSQAPVLGIFSAVKLRNPVGSNVIAVIEKVSFTSSQPVNTPDLQGGTNQVDGGTVLGTVGISWDNRGRTAGSTLIASTSGAAGVPSQVVRARGKVVANTTLEFIFTDLQEFPLPPGMSIQVVADAANVDMIATFWWRERFLEDSERS
jgi:hypothetical protein